MSQQVQSIIDHWAREAIKHASYTQLEDGSWFGRVPGCPGVVATASSRCDIEHELFSVLEEWALLGMQLGDDIPVHGNVDLNADESRRLAAYHA